MQRLPSEDCIQATDAPVLNAQTSTEQSLRRARLMLSAGTCWLCDASVKPAGCDPPVSWTKSLDSHRVSLTWQPILTLTLTLTLTLNIVSISRGVRP